jgi:hypothetical protein
MGMAKIFVWLRGGSVSAGPAVTVYRSLSLVLLILLAAGPVAAQTPAAGGSVTVLGQASEASQRAAQRLEALRWATADDDQDRLLGLLESTASDESLPLALREQVLFDYVQQLRSLPPNAADTRAMDFLASYVSRELIPHEDHPGAEVPRFNVRSAAAGVKHIWRRQEASYAGTLLLTRDPAQLVQAFRRYADPPIRQGLLDALENASAGALEVITFFALEHIEQEPQLARLAGTAALRTGDTRALEQLLRTADGMAVPGILRAARGMLDDDQLATLLMVTIAEAKPEIAALAIAELTPAVAQRADTRSELLKLLGDPGLGSAAALALAANPAAGTQVELTGVLQSEPGSLAAARAKLALEAMDAGLAERGNR